MIPIAIILLSVAASTGQILIDHYRFASTPGNNLLTGLEAYWTFDEASGDAADSSGNSRTLTEYGSLESLSPAKVVNARRHESSENDDYFGVSSGAWNTFGTNDFTIAFWFSPANTADPAEDYLLVNKWDWAAGMSWFIELDAGFLYPFGKAWAVYYSTNGTDYAEFMNLPLADFIENGGWYFLALTRSSSTNWALYYAHEDEPTITSSDTVIIDLNLYNNSTVPLTIGSALSGGAVHFSQDTDGYIDELGIWSRALSTCELLKLFNAGTGRLFGTFDANPCQ